MQYDEDHARLSATNHRIVSEFYSGVITGSPADPARLFHPDIVVHEPHLVPWGGIYTGMEGQRALGPRQSPYLDRSSLKVRSLFADGENVISVLEIAVKSDVPDPEILLSEHMRLIDGLIVEQRVYLFGHPSRPLSDLIPNEGDTTRPSP